MTRRLIALAAVAFVLDVAGATWGLPARWHPDEKADAAARMVRERTLDPGSFINPSLSVYAMVPTIAVQQALAGAGLLDGRAADPAPGRADRVRARGRVRGLRHRPPRPAVLPRDRPPRRRAAWP